MKRDELIAWLREDSPERLETLWATADAVRREHVGDAVHLRGLVELSNHCARQCAYCGLQADNRQLARYRMNEREIFAACRQAEGYGYGSVVLQSGEDYGISLDWMANVVWRIKSETALAVTLSLGERDSADLRAWREAGADRYLLRFETSNAALYQKLHPPLPGRSTNRIDLLRELKSLGYEIGSGVLIGLPGQTYDNLARDIELFQELDVDMIGSGPYLPHLGTILGRTALQRCAPQGAQIPATELMGYKMIALTRITCPGVNIPSTTALATLNRKSGRELGLMRGANVVMPNVTPSHYRRLYEIYPAKACLDEAPEDCDRCLRERIQAIGRTVGVGRGDSVHYTVAHTAGQALCRLE